MAKQFLTGLNLNKNELLNARIQNLTTAPASPVSGQIYYNSVEGTLYYYNGTSWLALAQGGDVSGAIANAIAAATTDDIDEGANNLYYTTARAQEDAASLLTGATKTNITITGNAVSGLTITAENGVADSDTDDLTEGTNNLYFTDGRATDAVANAFSGGTQQNISITYNAISKTFDVTAENGVAGSDTDDLVEGSNNLYFTNQRARDAVSAGDTSLTYNSISGAFTANTSTLATVSYVDQEISDVNNAIDGLTTTDIAEGTNEYFTNARARGAISVGDNTLTYNSVSGVLTANTTTLATTAYVDSVAQGLHIHASVVAATTGNVNISTDLEPGDVVDGVTLAEGDRVLVKSQTNSAQNGIYVVQASGAALRASDFNEPSEVNGGDFVFVTGGTLYDNTGWVQTSTGTVTIGTDPITFTQFSGAGTFLAGNGLTLDGNTFNVGGTENRISVTSDAVDISANYAGQTSITTVGTISAGTWQGNTIALAYGGTGATTAAGARSNLGATTKYAASNAELESVSNVVTWAVAHALNTSDVTVQVRDLGTNAEVFVDVAITNANTVTLSWNASANVAANSYRAVVVG
jgi:hypothetical protein